MLDTLSDRTAGHIDSLAYPPSIIAHPGGGYCKCNAAAVVWYVEADRKTALCAVCVQKLIASLETNADYLALEEAQERALAATLRATYAYAVALGMT